MAVQYRVDGEWRQAARTTGPRHNLLGLVFGDPPDGRPAIEAVGDHEGDDAIDAGDVLREVQEGLSDANKVLGTRFVAKQIRFVRSDTPGNGVYALLAREIARQAAAEESAYSRNLAAG